MTKPQLTSFATTRPVAILMLFMAAVVFGYFSLGRLPVTLMPELTYPTLTVRTEYPGAAPEEVENDISRPVEEALGVVSGLKKLASVSRADVSDVVLEFAWDTEMSDAIQDVLERLDLVMLPDEAKRPLILHYDPSLDPILELSLSGGNDDYEGEGGLRRLRRLADLQIKRALEPIKGVAAVRVKGGLEEEIHVLVEEEQLRRTGISIGQVIARLDQENINVAGGTIKDGRTEYLVRTLNEYEDVEQIADTVVASFEGRDVRVRDLGRVEASHKEREIITRTDGGESVQIEIYKEADTNSVALARRVKEALGESDVDLIVASAAAPVTFGDDEGGDDGPRAAPGLATSLYKEEGALLQIVADRSVFIQSSIREVFFTAAIGGLLAILVLFLFLKNVRTTAIIGVSIPISLLIVFAPLNLLGVTLNIMSLGGLALGIGMLVDSSIVVLESIHRCREEGDDVSSAAVRGTGEVRGAVLASTLTSIAVFFPMVFVEGVAGQAFGDLGLAVVVSLLAAAAVALFFIPMLASRGGGAKTGSEPRPDRRAMKRFAAWEVYRPALRRPLGWFRAAARPASTDAPAWRRRLRNLFKPFRYGAVALWAVVAWLYFTIRFVLGTIFEWVIGKPLLLLFSGLAWVVARVLWPALGLILRPLFWLPVKITDWLMKGLSGVYPAVLRRALANPLVILLVVGACFWGTWKVVTALDSELLPEVHQGEFTVEVELPVGTPLEETDLVLSPIEEAILAEREHIRALIVTLGFDSANSQRSDEGEHTARFKVVLEETRDPAALEQQVVSRLRKRFDGVPDLQARIVRPVLFSSRTPIEVEVHGDDLDRLKLYADRASEVMSTLPGLTDVQATLQSGAPEVQIVYDRDRLARYGMNVGEVARLVRDKVQGFEATRLNLKDRRVPIVVRLAADDRETVADVEGVIVNPGQDPPLPLASVAEVTLGEGPSEVRRVDGRRVALIRANIAEGSLGSATAGIENALRSRIDWPAGMTFLITGQQEEWESSKSSLWFALGLSIFLVYVIMAAQFESLVHPLVIMVSIPLAFIGTVVALLVLGISLSVVVFLGMIMLAGIVVNNAIVLVDYINRLRRRGMPRDEAIVTAGSVRLRPILMTTATTVLGLLPMALGLGDGAELRTPMAIAVISGLISSTALTLIVIPSLYAIADTLVAKLLGKRVQETRGAEETGALETLPGAGRGAVTP
jgi:HAE1 family hydrophobic/amphiphilic exporter-1